jgi:hypothetical protein
MPAYCFNPIPGASFMELQVGIAVRAEAPADHAAGREVNRLAFGREDEARLVDALRAGGYARLSLVAEEGGRVVGHVLFSDLPIVTGAGTLHALALAPVAILPERQRLSAAPAVAATHTRAVAAQLMQLFADFDTSAVTFAEENQASLRPAFDAATWEQFLRLIQGFAFADAQALLDQVLAHPPGS